MKGVVYELKNKQMKNNLFIFILLLINILVFSINIYAGDDIGKEKVFIEYPVINNVLNNIDKKIGSPVETIVDLENNCLYFIYKYSDDLISTVNNNMKNENNNQRTVKIHKEKTLEKLNSNNNHFAIVKSIDNAMGEINFSNDKSVQNNQSNLNFKINNFSTSETKESFKSVENEKKKNNEFGVKKALINNNHQLNLRKIKKDNELKEYKNSSSKKQENYTTYNSKKDNDKTTITYDDYEKYLEYLKKEYDFK